MFLKNLTELELVKMILLFYSSVDFNNFFDVSSLVEVERINKQTNKQPTQRASQPGNIRWRKELESQQQQQIVS